MRTKKETRRSIAPKSFILKMFSKLYLEAATESCSLKLLFLKCWQHNQLSWGTAILKEHLLLATTVYYLSQNLECLRILQIILLILLKTPNRGHLKRIFNSNILWNLVFVIFDFTRCKTLVHSTRFLYSSLMRTKQNQIYLLWFTSFTALCKFYEKLTLRFFFPIIDTEHTTSLWVKMTSV